jgi:cholesterol transport system auxiliary component
MTGIAARSFVAALALLVSSGCAILKPADVETHKEMLVKIPAEIAQGSVNPGTVLVLAPTTRTVYDTTDMAYETRRYEIAYFSRTEWGERPSQMLQRLILQTLEKAHCFRAVVAPPFTGHYTHALQTEILAFHHDFTAEPAAFQLTLRVQMTVRATHEVSGTREISVREPMQEKTAYAGAVAANEATAKALKEIADFVRETTG